MEKRKWPWKKKPSERSPGDSESSGSFSSHSERYSDEQEVLKESPNYNSESLEITSKEAALMEEEVKETVKSLTEKLSAALVNISAKEDLVKQHAKVAEEAVAGWEKAENEATVLKNQLESALRNQNLEVRVNDAIQHQRKEWDTQKSELENQIFCLQAEVQKPASSLNRDTLLTLESLERENSSLKQELRIMTIERDLSTRAAENASRLQLESIKRIAKLEAECRRLESIARKSSPLISSQKSFGVSSFNADSFKDNNSCMSSNTGSEQNCSPKNLTVEIDMMDDFLEMERIASLSGTEENTVDCTPLRADTDLMAQRVEYLEIEFKKMEKEKLELKNALDESGESLKAALNQMAEGEMKLAEMEKEVRTIRETKELLEFQLSGVEVEARTLSGNVELLKAEIKGERQLSARLTSKCRELEGTVTGNVESFKTEIEEERKLSARLTAKCRELEGTLSRNVESLKTEIEEERKLSVRLTAKCRELEGTLSGNVESLKAEIEEERKFSAGLTAKYREVEGTLSGNVESLKAEIEEERKLSAGLTAKCQELEGELSQRIQDSQVEEITGLDVEPKIKEEDLAVAADKLADCQKTIASLGRQLESLATLEDFLIDTSSIPGFSKVDSATEAETWRLPCRDYSDISRMSSTENHHLEDDSYSLQAAYKNRNGFANFFSRSKSVIKLENYQD